MTEKLYLTNGMTLSFDAVCLSCQEAEGGYLCELSATAFFPGGGGQEADSGTLNGIPVIGMKEEGEAVYHLLAQPLEVGASVRGEVDKRTRFARMQSHTGEHIISGIVHRLFGYNNVGFHMGEDGMTVDFDGELTDEQIRLVEDQANVAVWNDLPVNILLPTDEELKSLDYRSKKELTGQVRVVEIEGVDLCACCAPHLDRTGRVGIIKILDHIRWRGGVRIKLLCGLEALEDYRLKYANNKAVAEALKVKQSETAEAFERYALEVTALKRELTEVRKSLMTLKAEGIAPTEGNICLFEEGLSAEDMRTVCNLLVNKCRVAAVFSKTPDGYTYTLASQRVPLRGCIKAFNEAVGGRGGGSDEMVTGRANGNREAIEGAVKAL